MSKLRLTLLAIALLLFSGCTEMRVEGEAKVFQTSATGTMIQILIGIGLMGLGVVGLAGSVWPDRKPKNRMITPKDRVPIGQRIGVALFGCAMGFMGLMLVAFTFLFPHKLHVTVHPDRVEMASTYSQTGGREKVLFFSNLSKVEMRDEPNVVGKLRTCLVFTHVNGPPTIQEAGNNERQAFETIQQALAEYKAKKPAEGRNPTIANNPSSSATSSDGNTPAVPPSNNLTGEIPEEEIRPAPPGPKEYSLKRYKISAAIPAGYTVVGPDTEVKVGDKLQACWMFGAWSTLTVVEVNSDGTVTCNWDTWKSYTYKMMREDLVIQSDSPSSTPSSSSSPPTDPSIAPPTSKYSLKRYEITIPVPEGWSILTADTKVEVGMKLGACYAGSWDSVTVVDVNDDGTIACNWDNWKSYTYNMVREDLIISNNGSSTPSAVTPTPNTPSKFSFKRYKVTIPVPKGWRTVTAETKVKVGMKLGACYAGSWEKVTVVAVNDDGTIACNWDNWKSFTYNMVREDLIIQTR